MDEIIHLEALVQTKDLSHALSLAASIVEKRNIQPILNNTKISAKANNIELTTTDTSISLLVNIGAQVKNEGEVTVSSILLTEIIRKIPDLEIKLILRANQLEIISKNCHFNLATISAAEFPSIEQFEIKSSIKLSCKDFVRVLDYTKFSMSLEETRYNLNGIYLHVNSKDNKVLLSAASTDGHRLSVSSIITNQDMQDFGIILPRKTALEILKIVKDSKNIDHNIKVELGLTRVKFTTNNIIMVSKLIDGNFPQYDSFIPKNNLSKLVINTKLFSDAIERAALVTLEKHKAVKLTLSEDGIDINAFGEAKGKAHEQLPISNEKINFCNFSGDKIIVGFNPKYLIDVLNTIEEEQIEILLKDDSSPALIKLSNHLYDNFIIMPVKV